MTQPLRMKLIDTRSFCSHSIPLSFNSSVDNPSPGVDDAFAICRRYMPEPKAPRPKIEKNSQQEFLALEAWQEREGRFQKAFNAISDLVMPQAGTRATALFQGFASRDFRRYLSPLFPQ